MNALMAVPGTEPAPQVSTDDNLIEAWLHGRPATTQRAYRADIAAFRQHVGKPLRMVTVPDVQSFQASLTGRSDASVARVMSSVKSLLTFGQRIGYVTFNAGVAVRLPKIENRLAERIVDRDQVRDLLREAAKGSPRDHALLVTMYYAGLRISEVCGLEWRHIKARDNGQCQVTVYGKGGKTRTVLLPEKAASALLALRGDAGETDPVFRGREGDGRLDPSRVHQIIKAVAARAGLPAEFSAHWLRHANASHALDAGAPAHVVQQTLGHASLATTSRYVHARPCDSSGLYLDKC